MDSGWSKFLTRYGVAGAAMYIFYILVADKFPALQFESIKEDNAVMLISSVISLIGLIVIAEAIKSVINKVVDLLFPRSPERKRTFGIPAEKDVTFYSMALVIATSFGCRLEPLNPEGKIRELFLVKLHNGGKVSGKTASEAIRGLEKHMKEKILYVVDESHEGDGVVSVGVAYE
ncbi:hypothetical protein R7007_03105 [Vibrio sp. 1636]|uniref:Uncharacterized protein n=1 Tax=Vibrio alginolyticus TaxID=663 RepID=A0A7Y0MTW2_VIBAL|nr:MULTISPECIES: hypothetical protein [Vibrio]MDW2200644.1 hypothetical protein [Vibrio sp. 1636]NMR72605.1 hypothetical protein [Vibrio alginolyticus]